MPSVIESEALDDGFFREIIQASKLDFQSIMPAISTFYFFPLFIVIFEGTLPQKLFILPGNQANGSPIDLAAFENQPGPCSVM